MEKAKIAILHPKFGKGGSEARALWILDALKNEHQVFLITSGKLDIQELNEYYGTNLNSEEFSIIQVPLPFFLQKTEKFAALRGHLIQKYCQKLAPNFDLLISTYNLCDFGKKSIQFIADFSFDEEFRQNIIPENFRKWYLSKNLFREIYLKFCNFISPFNQKILERDIVISNSNWTAKLIKEKYGIATKIIYPPVANNFLNIPFQQRENGFVFIGRITPEKGLDKVIEILNIVRRKGFDIHLHIVGGIEDKKYGEFLKKNFQKNKDWIFSEGWLGEEKKKDIIVKHRFGISACKNEAFGISVAEMVKAGCIVFVPNGGGQKEIVNHHLLIYDDVDDAAEKIKRVLSNQQLQDDILKHLAKQKEKFSLDIFKKQVKNLVSKLLNQA